MPVILSPTESAILLAFAENECLYRDHHGRRVLVDFEGAGYARIRASNLSVHRVREDEVVEEFAGSFDNGLLLVTEGVGPIEIDVYLGRSAPLEVGQTEVATIAEGAGWILSSEGSVTLDSQTTVNQIKPSRLPIPFFFRAEAKTSFEFLRADVMGLRTDSLRIWEEESLKQHCPIGFNVREWELVRRICC